jgi:hypothetical protein
MAFPPVVVFRYTVLEGPKSSVDLGAHENKTPAARPK